MDPFLFVTLKRAINLILGGSPILPSYFDMVRNYHLYIWLHSLGIKYLWRKCDTKMAKAKLAWYYLASYNVKNRWLLGWRFFKSKILRLAA